MPRRFTRTDGSTFVPDDVDPDGIAAELVAQAPALAGLLADLRRAERAAVLRLVHEGNLWQDGGSHPNAYTLSRCATCRNILAELGG